MYRDYSDGYVGCMRALVLNGVAVDLVREVTKKPWGLYGVTTGCVGKCRNHPCLNGGKCLEGYDSFNCDCRWTPFKVPVPTTYRTVPYLGWLGKINFIQPGCGSGPLSTVR